MQSNIKTVCGLEKYEELSKRKGFFNRVRFYWFVLFASIRDFCKKKISRRNSLVNTAIFQFYLNLILLILE